MFKTAAYARFSSDAQRESSIRDQMRNIDEYCQRAGWSLPIRFEDHAITGARNDRPGYRAMLEAARRQEFDVLLIDDLSRLSRDQLELLTATKMLRHLGIRVIGVSDSSDTSRSGSKLEVSMRGLINELSLDDLAEKTHRGLKGQALEGFCTGGLPYGYRGVDAEGGKRAVVYEEQAKWVRFIVERYAAGWNPRQIANELNRLGVPSPRGSTWAHAALYPDRKKFLGLLANEIYIGRLVWNRTDWDKDPVNGKRRRRIRPREEWVVHDCPELAIVDADTWRTCQARAERKHKETVDKRAAGKGAGGRGPKYLLSGLLRCGVCGGAYVIQTPTQYGCATHKDRGPSVCTNGLKVKRSTVEQVLLSGVRRDLLSEEAYQLFEAESRRLLTLGGIDTGGLRRQLQAAKRKLDNLVAAISEGLRTKTTMTAMMAAENDVERLQEEIVQVEKLRSVDVLPQAREIYRKLIDSLGTIEDVAAARECLRQIIGTVQLIPEGDALTAETQSAGLAGALRITVVAGAGFEPATFGL